jgi:hypothetical protein
VHRSSIARLLTVTATLAAGTGSAMAAGGYPTGTGGHSFLASLKTVTSLTSTVPPNGDENPYGLVTVPTSVGKLQAGDLLVSNFNAKSNTQGTGTTIDQITPNGTDSLFSQINPKTLPGSCPGGVGLTTALNVLPGGYVVVGSLPTTNGSSITAQFGCLIVLDSAGKAVETIAGRQIAGPWDMTAVSQGSNTTLFVSNALNGGAAEALHTTLDNSTVLRIRLTSGTGRPPKVLSEQVVAKSIPWRDDKTALVIGPTGVALAKNGTLYLADTLENEITAIPDAMTRTTAISVGGIVVSKGGHLNQPLGLVLAPNGDILTANAGDGNIVETTPAGKQVAVAAADPKAGAGSLFGIDLTANGSGLFFVDDGDNTLRLLH